MELRREEENLEKYHGHEIKRNERLASHPSISGPEKKIDGRDERGTGCEEEIGTRERAGGARREREGEKRDVFNL